METKGLRRWLILALISFSGGVSFDLAYLRYIYQIPMVEFMGFTNTEVGLIMSSFGIAAIALYAPSGLIADKFSHKWMITLSMIATGLLGLLMATYPPFWVMIMIQIGFGITTVLTLWSVTIKAASLLGSADEQGSIMGWMEGFRGVGVMTLAVFTMWVFSKIGESNPNSLRTVILIYSSVYIILGVLCWFFVPHGRHEQSDQNSVSSNILQDIVTVLKRKITWYCSAIVFGVFTIYAILSYSTNYLTEHFGMSLVAASYMGVVINKIFRAICGPAGGLICTYSSIKSSTRVIRLGSMLCMSSIAALLLVNQNPTSALLAIGLILVITFVCMASRGLYWATVGESGTPKRIMGTTVGVCSVLGFMPDVFVYPIVGYWQDTLPAVEAYRNMWILGFAGMAMVFIASGLLIREINKLKQVNQTKDLDVSIA